MNTGTIDEKKAASPDSLSARSLVNRFRQTRHSNDGDRVSIVVQGHKGVVKNYSRTGIGFEMPNHSPKPQGVSFEKAQVFCQDILLYEGDIEVKYSRPADGDATYYGGTFQGAIFLIEAIDSALVVHECGMKVEQMRAAMVHAEPAFCQSVLALNAALRCVRETCRAEEERWRNLTFDQRCEAERVLLPNLVSKVISVFMYFNIKISQQVDVEALPENSVYHQIFHQEIYPYFEGADLIRRAYEKPRGYAGDYEMMNQIYRNGFEGKDLFGRVLHHYITNENSAESVKFRKPFFYGYYNRLLERRGFQKVLSIACGPAVEFQQVVKDWAQSDLDRISVTLFDLDREALEHAQLKIFDAAFKYGKRPNVSFINASVKSFLMESAQAADRYDLIYSGGLFDYLDNLTSSALIKKFETMLNPGGTLIIGNFTKENLTIAFLHLLTNWTLIHKTEQEMMDWAQGIENCRVSIEYDTKRMNAFLVLTKKDVDSTRC